ncbi:hypothetical protein [Streptomyces sp. NPDC057302]|uniref:hypothetical protein n=1 Tax=Streptomyces sp. NPDC057302 TaxID=3346094 RepID=UPI0036291F96
MTQLREIALEAALPELDSLSVAQTCGRACVRCAVTLCTATAVELGEHRGEGGFTWFPRSCRLCASRPAYLALLAHIQSCEQCADEPARCTEGRALRQELREARR